jgi:mannose-1-phosphate guanylyltransferase/phosphomannomutase
VKAVVMAGGEGTRLRPLTITRPKPMMPVVNKPCLEHIFDLLKGQGIDEVIVTCHYLSSAISTYFGDGSAQGLRIVYSVEETPLGTAGSVRNARRYLDDTFLVVSGDALTDFDLRALVDYHRQQRALATLTLYRVPNPLEYGLVIAEPDGRIRQFQEKPSWGEVFSDTINTGIYVLEPEILDGIDPHEAVDFSREVFPRLLAGGRPLFGYVAGGYWSDIGDLDSYRRANADVLLGKVRVRPAGPEIRPGVWAEPGVEVAEGASLFGPIFLGAGVEVRAGAVIHGPSVIQSQVVIDERVQIDRSIIWSGTYIGEGAKVNGAVIQQRCSVKDRARVFEGAVIGEGTLISQDATIQANVKIWPDKEIEPGATVTRSLIWGSQGRRVLFGSYGVTGQVNVEITPEFAAKLGAAYAALHPRDGYVTVSRQPHRSARMIKRGLVSGLPSGGLNVLDIKSTPVPVSRYLTRTSDAVGGIHVTVSPHNARVVDIRFWDADGLDIDKPTERRIENTYFREDFRRVNAEGIGQIIDAPQHQDRYVAALEERLRLRQIQRNIGDAALVIDYAHGPAALVLPAIASKFGANVVTLNASVDESKLALAPSEVERSIGQLAAIAAGLKASLGVRIEVGGERLTVVDDAGARIDDVQFLAALASLVLRTAPGGVVVVPVSAPRIFDQIARLHGGRVLRARASAQWLMREATRPGVVLAGDGHGGIIFPEFHPGFDALLATARIVELLTLEGVRLADVVAELPTYHQCHLEVPCPWEAKGRVMRRLSERYPSEAASGAEGVHIHVDAAWVLIIPDADLALFHVYAEGDSPEAAARLGNHYASELAALVP